MKFSLIYYAKRQNLKIFSSYSLLNIFVNSILQIYKFNKISISNKVRCLFKVYIKAIFLMGVYNIRNNIYCACLINERNIYNV